MSTVKYQDQDYIGRVIVLYQDQDYMALDYMHLLQHNILFKMVYVTEQKCQNLIKIDLCPIYTCYTGGKKQFVLTIHLPKVFDDQTINASIIK